MLLYLPGASGLRLQLFWQSINDKDTMPSFPQIQPVSLGKELVQHNKQITWTAKLKSLTVFMQRSPSHMLAILVLWGHELFYFQFLSCNSLSKSEVLFITSVLSKHAMTDLPTSSQ